MKDSKKINPEDIKPDNRRSKNSFEKNESFRGETSPTEMRRSFSLNFLGNTAQVTAETKEDPNKPKIENKDTDFPELASLKK